MKLKELHINNFKFFPKQDPKSPLLKINGKNLLIYGENGSGKSTIYWAIYTLLESSFKDKDVDVSKYFTKGGEGLVNIHAPKNYQSYIKAVLSDGTINTEYKVSGDITEIQTIRANTDIRESGMASDFINYRVLFALHQVKNSKENDLFPWFEDEILPYIRIRVDSFLALLKTISSGPAKVKDLYENDIYPNPAMSSNPNLAIRKYYEFYKKYEIKVKKWNAEFKRFIKRIEINANEILINDFKQDFPIKLELTPFRFTISDTNFKPIKPEIKIKVPKFQGKRNPISKLHTFLNEAKWTAIGLSIRLAIIKDWTNRPATAEFKCLVLDDMLLSLDMSNRDKVLNILLTQLNDYQIILLTHDKLFFEIAKHRINIFHKREKWQYLEMYTGERTQKKLEYPIILGDSDDYYAKAKKYFLRTKVGRNSDIDYPAAANYLRKECEKTLKDLLYGQYLFKSNSKTGETSIKDGLGELFEVFKRFFTDHGLNFSDFSNFEIVIKLTLNPLSHDNIGKPLYKKELEEAFEFVNNLRLISKKELFSKTDHIFLSVTDTGGIITKFKIKLLNDIYVFKQGTLVKTNIFLSKFTLMEYEANGLVNFYPEQIDHLDKLYDFANLNILGVNNASTGQDMLLKFDDDQGQSIQARINSI